MPAPIRDSKPPKKRGAPTIDGEPLRQARKLDLDLAHTPTERREGLERDEHARRWLDENHEAIQEFNRFAEEHGVVSDRLRQF